MHFNILTIFPEMFPGTLGGGVIGRALERGQWSYDTVNIRDFAYNNYGSVDDEQFGGGVGMVMRPDVLGNAIDSIKNLGKIIYFSPRGPTLNQKMVRKFAAAPDATYTLLCGRYEGIDQRIIDEYDIMELSIGDYVLTGGELPALVLADSITRLLPGVLSGNECFEEESHYNGLLEYPQYTRPFEWHGKKVPNVLLSGHHANIERWRRDRSLERTSKRRPDMIEKIKDTLSERDLEILK